MPKQTTWEEASKKVLGTPKFVAKGTKVIVEPTEPVLTQVKGRYGQREMYIVETKGHGLIYVSPMQLVKVARAFNGDYSSAVTVEL